MSYYGTRKKLRSTRKPPLPIIQPLDQVTIAKPTAVLTDDEERMVRLKMDKVQMQLAEREVAVREREGFWSMVQGLAISAIPIVIPLAAFFGVKEFFGLKK